MKLKFKPIMKKRKLKLRKRVLVEDKCALSSLVVGKWGLVSTYTPHMFEVLVLIILVPFHDCLGSFEKKINLIHFY